MFDGRNFPDMFISGDFRLSKLIAFYDDNGISIDGHVGAGLQTIRQQGLIVWMASNS